MANKLIALEGQIGAGKTTLGLILAESLDVPFYAELAAENTERLLDRFYPDRSRWAFTMQTHFITHRAAMLSAMPQGTGGILDRSLSGDRIFAEVLHEEGYMDDLEFSAYAELFDLLSALVPPPDLMVYLDCNVDVALERIRRRNRPAESAIPRRYLDHLDRRYRAWYASYSRSPKLRIPFDEMAVDEPGVAASLVEMIREAAHADRS